MGKHLHRIEHIDHDAHTVTCATCGTVRLVTVKGRAMCPEGRIVQKGNLRRKDGYRFRRVGGRWVPEHRIVMAQAIGRNLLDHETPHHVNGVRDDNRPENLELWSSSQPPGQRVADKVAWAREIIALYGHLSA